MITIEDLQKCEIKIGKVLSAERVEGSEKLLKLLVDLGEETPRQILSGIAKVVEPEALVDKLVPVVANLEPREMMGLVSQGMILCADDPSTNLRTGGGPVLLHPAKDVPPGSSIK